MHPDKPDEQACRNQEECVSRRGFVCRLGTGVCGGSLGLAAVGMLRSVSPWAFPEPSGRFKIGLPADYPEGSIKSFPEGNTIVFREQDGIFAISTICTHLGCVTTRTDSGFQCPCHGSLFSPLGELLQGPAPKGLDWLEVAMLPSGQLVVDRAKPVGLGIKLNLNVSST